MSAFSSVATRDIAYACRILVADALVGKKALMKVGKGLPRLEREKAIVREVFGDVDVDALHARVEREWRLAGMKSSSIRRRPTGTDIANYFWTLFLRRVYRDDSRARLDEPVDVPRSLVVSGGPVGTRRRVRAAFFEERRASPNTLRTVLEELVGSERKTFAREWFTDLGWHDVLGLSKNERRENTVVSSGASGASGVSTTNASAATTPAQTSYMTHPLDTPHETTIIDVLSDSDEPVDGRDDLFACGSGCGRAWDGNSQCQCFL